ncbi:MAG: serine hydrolase [Blautia sp.]|jgi:beta-lactamase class A
MAGKYSKKLFLGLFIALLLMLSCVTVQAKTQKVEFTDGSGTYLIKKSSGWYLKDKDDQALTGIVYLKVNKYDYLQKGYYYFDSKGRLEEKQGICRFVNRKVNGQTFHGYYYHTDHGRFCDHALGIRLFADGLASDAGRVYKGYYYIGPYGKVTADARMRYLKEFKSGGIRFETGYYYFEKGGRLSRTKTVHKIQGSVHGKKWNGLYYFGNANGRLSTSAGWKKIGSDWYYFGPGGKAYQNRWAGSYYLGKDGKMLTNCRTPDGYYVDCSGKVCKKEEMRFSSLKAQLQQECASVGGSWAVYVKDLKTGDYLVTSEQSMYSASVIKPFVMASMYDCIKRGQVADSGSVQSLLREMITVSDNEAYNELVRRQGVPYGFASGAATVNQYLSKNGYQGTTCRHTLHPAGSSYAGIGGSNLVSAKDCGMLLERIYKGTCVSKQASSKMLNLLLNQERRVKIPSGLPSGTKVANKTGETSSVQHDMAIVWGPKTDYVICVLSAGLGEYSAIREIQKISAKVYDYLQRG